MTTIICKFKSRGKDIKKTAILNDTLTEISKSKKNEAYDVLEYENIGIWMILFEGEAKTIYEIEFQFDTENNQKTLKPTKAITWGTEDASVIIDAETVKVTVK